MFKWIKRLMRGSGDAAPMDVKMRAVLDQDSAEYPYCREGHMQCRSLCDCRDTPFSRHRFRKIRERVHLTGVEPIDSMRGNIKWPM